MMRFPAIWLGPELGWMLCYAVARVLVAGNRPPTPTGNARLELVLWFLPLAGVLVSFAPLWWSAQSFWWMLLRIFLAGGTGLFAVVTCLCEGIDYGDSRNSGVGSAYILFLSLGFLVLIIGEAIAVVWRLIVIAHP